MSLPERAVTVTLAPEHWLRIRQALLSAAEDLAQLENPEHRRYFHTYQLICHVTDKWEVKA
jgi:hypothetical protein